jgi:hypothetical protein
VNSDIFTHEGCGGEWQPCSGWYARYRCGKCSVFGHRKAIITVDVDPDRTRNASYCYGPRNGTIAPYCCAKVVYDEVEGPPREKGKQPTVRRSCGRPAVARDSKGTANLKERYCL